MSLAPQQAPSTGLSWDRSPPSGLARSAISHGNDGSSSHSAVNVPHNERLLSALGGGLAVVWGLSHHSVGGKLAAALGSALIYRGVSGHCHVYEALGIDRAHDHSALAHGGHARVDEPVALTGRARAARSFDVLRSVTVQRSAEAVFRAWRDPETFAQAMSHFASHTTLDAGRTRWTLEDPIGGEHSWVTEIVAEQPGKLIRWQTVQSAPLVKNLTLELRPAPGNRGTEMTLHLRLEPPRGVLGSALVKLFGKAPAWIIDRALFNVKSLLEAGELPSLKNNSSARSSART
jgi:uncharacterized membrane protein